MKYTFERVDKSEKRKVSACCLLQYQIDKNGAVIARDLRAYICEDVKMLYRWQLLGRTVIEDVIYGIVKVSNDRSRIWHVEVRSFIENGVRMVGLDGRGIGCFFIQIDKAERNQVGIGARHTVAVKVSADNHGAFIEVRKTVTHQHCLLPINNACILGGVNKMS